MLESLNIKNIALIEDTTIDFENGLNILSGETGAGKSMVIDSVNFVLGQRVSKDIIRKGQESAQVKVIFSLNSEYVISACEQLGIEIDDDGALLIQRSINSSGKSTYRINGSQVTAGILKQVSELLIDIHGQHEHQSLLNSSKHIEILDKFCGEELDKVKTKLGASTKEYRKILKSLNDIVGDEKERAQKIDLYRYQIDDISSVNPRVGEDDELLQRRKILSNVERIITNKEEVLSLLYDDDEGMSALDRLSRSVSLISDNCNYDESFEQILEMFETIEVDLDEAIRELRRYGDDSELDPRELSSIEKRLDQIYALKKKYGSSIEDILEHLEKVTSQLDFLNNSENEKENLIIQKQEYETKIKQMCKELSDMRKSNAQKIEKHVILVLSELGMQDAKFSICVEQKNEFTSSGFDKVEFLFSANKGESLKPLAKIASGGEMSRVMLALKTVFADSDFIETFIFDEIDTGVSGRTAQQVAEKLASISQHHQIICITHLPQIAAMADAHFLITKSSDDTKTTTEVSLLTNNDVINELARLIGGAEITTATIAAAAEMKELANRLKDLD